MYTTYDIFDDLLGARNWFDRFWTELPRGSRIVDTPYLNLYEKDDNLEIAVLAPGLKVEDLNIQLVDNSLIIEGVKKSDYEDKPYIRKEREFDAFKKSVRLPYRVDAANIKATMKEGILTIKLAKAEEAKPKKIQIN